ncbi:uncharacterized protein TNCV_3334461 [Trichonephila clavipes]|nr:uncharacterized protein TNCV_3334461 [Trichonephila clavipes]
MQHLTFQNHECPKLVKVWPVLKHLKEKFSETVTPERDVECYREPDQSGRRKREIPKFLPHYTNEAFEVEISAFLRIKADVEGDIVFEESTNDTLDTYDADYSSELGEIIAGGLTTNSQSHPISYYTIIILTLCVVFIGFTTNLS